MNDTDKKNQTKSTPWFFVKAVLISIVICLAILIVWINLTTPPGGIVKFRDRQYKTYDSNIITKNQFEERYGKLVKSDAKTRLLQSIYTSENSLNSSYVPTVIVLRWHNNSDFLQVYELVGAP